MVECNGVFERKEVKYRLDAAQYKAVLSAMKGRLAPDAYGSTLVRSMYFDTEGRDMIARSIEKPLYKEKLRVRSYGTPAEDDAVFVEIKKEIRRRGLQAPRVDVVCRGEGVFERRSVCRGVRGASYRRRMPFVVAYGGKYPDRGGNRCADASVGPFVGVRDDDVRAHRVRPCRRIGRRVRGRGRPAHHVRYVARLLRHARFACEGAYPPADRAR